MQALAAVVATDNQSELVMSFKIKKNKQSTPQSAAPVPVAVGNGQPPTAVPPHASPTSRKSGLGRSRADVVVESASDEFFTQIRAAVADEVAEKLHISGLTMCRLQASDASSEPVRFCRLRWRQTNEIARIRNKRS